MKLYRAFLVRCWQEGQVEPAVWRFALIEIGDVTHMRGFADFAELSAFLSRELGDISPNASLEESAPTKSLHADFTGVG